jgi:glycosyltransferase involved in cell wall biosynthesis
MHVLLIHQHFATLTDGGGTRHFELGRALVEAGHRVTVVAGSVSYLTGELVPSAHGASTVTRPFPGMEIRRGRAYQAIHRSFVARAGSFASFMASSFWIGLTVPRVDVVLGTSPPLLQGLSGLAIARLKRVPFVFEVRDLWPDFAVAAGVLRHRPLIRGLRRIERLLYKYADHLIVNSPGFISHLRARGVPETQLDVIPNGVDVAMFHPARHGSAIRERHQLVGKFVCVYAGAHGAANDLETLLRAAERLRGYPDIGFLLVGDGKERGRLIHLARERELGNVVFVDAQPKNRMPDILAAADVCVAILQWTPMFATTYPNKVFDYMAAGRPTVLAIDGVIRNVIEAAEGGLFVPGANPDALAAAVLTYYRNPELRVRHGANARRYVTAHFDRTLQANRLKTVLESLVQPSRSLRLKRSRV